MASRIRKTGASNEKAHSAAEKALCARVARLCRDSSLSDVARQTTTPVASVYRYTQGARVPAWFCGALVSNMGVNPAWLLVGEGAPMLADVPQRTARMAGGMLELVEAMNAVAHMRLGSLTGKQNRLVLRELQDAATRHEKLRGRLNEQVRPVVTELLGSVRRAFERTDTARAGELLGAIGDLLRFCDDEQLRRHAGQLNARLAYVDGRRADAVDLQRRNLLLLLADPAPPADEVLRQAFNLSAALSGIARLREAMGMAHAALAITESRGEQPASWWVLNGFLGLLQLESGELAAGTPRIAATLGRHEDWHRPVVAVMRTTAALMSGLQSVESMAAAPLEPSCVPVLLRYAILAEQPTALRAALGAVKSLGPDPLRAAHMFGEQATLVLALLEKRARRRDPDAAALAHLGSMPGGGEFSVKVYDAQRARLAGDERASAMLTREAEDLRRTMDASLAPDLAVLGVHFRNALASGSDIAGQATHFFQEKLNAGYACFRRDAPK